MKFSAEAELAKHIARRHGFQPGNDLRTLVQIYADVETRLFPVDTVDGISLYLKLPNKRPNILLNSSIPDTRRLFTLAHEFGHVIIPWHFGMVFSNISGYEDSVNSAYREMEAEANRFAAELLMPHAWLVSLYDESKNPAEMLETVLGTCGTSVAAAIIAINNCLPPGYVYASTNEENEVLTSYTSTGTFVAPFSKGDALDGSSRMDECVECDYIKIRGIEYNWLFFESEQKLEAISDTRDWRNILDEIIFETDPENSQPNIKMSLNGIISACNKPGVTQESFYAAARQKLAGRDSLRQRILAHPLFNTFLIKRIEEFIARKKN
jgi:Zn-dependent peptidase ImmA (M78 family)